MRRYCSRCLQAFGTAQDPDRCTRSSCRRHRPESGWPQFLTLGRVIDERYRVEEILGAGGAGITYRAVDLKRGDDIALKLLHTDRSGGVLAQRLIIEGEVLELLEHPHIVPFRAMNLASSDHVYLATCWMPGGSLDTWLRRHGPLSPRGVEVLGRQLALALDYVHAGGIVHRDIKPGNVLLERADPDDPLVRLGDFGIARLFRAQRPTPGLTRTGAFIGTPEYAAPEQRRGEGSIGPAADAFALGALLHQAATGRALHSREDVLDWENFRDLAWNPDDRPRLTDELGADPILERLDDVIDLLMHPHPDGRLEVARAAIALGADPDDLTPQDLPGFSPPSLITMEALIPPEDDGAATLDEAAEPAPGAERPRPAATPTDTREALPAVARTLPQVDSIGPSPARERAPRELGIGPTTRDTADEWERQDLAWPTADDRGARTAGRLLLAAALLLGVGLAWPGGPGALIGPQGLERIAQHAPRLAAALSVPADTRAVEPPPAGRPGPGASRPQPASATLASMNPARPPAREAAPSSARKPAAREAKVEPQPTPRSPPGQPAAIDPQPTPAPATRPQPTPAPGDALTAQLERISKTPAAQSVDSAVEAWADDPRDQRSLREVLDEQVAAERQAFLAELAREQVQAELRARQHQNAARKQDASTAQRKQDWEDAQRRARAVQASDPAPQAPTQPQTEPAIGTKPPGPVRDGLDDATGKPLAIPPSRKPPPPPARSGPLEA